MGRLTHGTERLSMVPEQKEGRAFVGGPAWKESCYLGEPMSKIVKLPLETPLTSAEAIALFSKFPSSAKYRARPPADADAIEACEEKLKGTLPKCLKSALVVHDGIREMYVRSLDILGGTKTLPKLRRNVRTQWTDLSAELGEEVPFRFGKRYIALGASNGTGHDFALLDTKRLLDDDHPVIRFDFEDGEELTGFLSLRHYLHWSFLAQNEYPVEKLRKLFPERYSTTSWKKAMRAAEKAPSED